MNESEEVAYEAILINQIRPKYNIQFKDEGNFNVKIPEFQWNLFEWEYEGQFAWLKKKKMGVINAKDVIINCIDDIQMVEDEGNRFVKERMDYVLKNIKAIAVQLSVPIIGSYCISSKEIEKRADHRPFLSDLEYNGLRTYPDNIQLLYRDWMYNMESEQKNIEEIIIVKNMLGDIYCAYMVVVDGTCANL